MQTFFHEHGSKNDWTNKIFVIHQLSVELVLFWSGLSVQHSQTGKW